MKFAVFAIFIGLVAITTAYSYKQQGLLAILISNYIILIFCIDDSEQAPISELYRGEVQALKKILDVIIMTKDKKYYCYSGRQCEGKVLSNRDPHNCKVKSKGKSIAVKQKCGSYKCYCL